MSAPIKNTCPDIDKFIRNIESAIYKSSQLKLLGEEELRDAANDMSNELGECIGYLEEMRKNNAALREWGSSLEDELQDAGEIINELENKLSESV